ncbi:hypothetical protein AGMMS49940_18420 [Spirochaetia bacterium]|nr:hypothetical protein AGMMS49940_18420 [Spirochaetia bacterium]
MGKTGLLNEIYDSVYNIDLGRKGLDTDGNEHQGRLSYASGISSVMSCFQEAQTTADCELLILAEETFLEQELHYCDTADTITFSSLTQAIRSFEDALRSLKIVVVKTLYQAAEATYATTKNRIQGCPRDIFHQACDAHRTRLSNSLRAPGINMKEKSVIQQRMANMKTAASCYIEKQKRALSGVSLPQ